VGTKFIPSLLLEHLLLHHQVLLSTLLLLAAVVAVEIKKMATKTAAGAGLAATGRLFPANLLAVGQVQKAL
jgi:hypothetical protein